MAHKLLLCVSTNGTVAARWKSGRITDCVTFGTAEADIAAFRNYAAASGNTPALIIVDAVEEDYRSETLPHASGSDRAQMIERKLRQHYRNSPYSAALLIGRDSGKRRDDRFLLAALTNPEIVAPWLAALAEAGLPVGGVYLLPMVLSGMVTALKDRPHNLLLVAQHQAGIRLTFFQAGVFRLSRLSRNDAGDDARGRSLIDEISNTRLYLHALRVATLDEPLTVLLLDHADQFAGTAQTLSEDNPGMHCTRLGPEDIAAQLKLDPAWITESPATVYLHLLGIKAPANNLAPAAVTAGYRRHQSRRQLFTASALAAVAGLIWAGSNLSLQLSLQEQTAELAQRTARANAEYQAATRQFPAAPTSADNLRKAAELAEKLRAAATTPEQLFGVVARALTPSPEIALVELGWQNSAAGIEAGAYAAAASRPDRNTAGNTSPRQSGLLAGQVRDFRGDFRGAIASINALAERLRRDPDVESVRVVQLPLNVNPTLALTGNTTENPAQSGSADFKLAVTLKQGRPK